MPLTDVPEKNVTDLPRPQATRLRRPSWRDTRLISGLCLMVGATVLGSRVVASADDTVPVQVAAQPLVAGAVVGSDDLRTVRVRLDDAAPVYVDGRRPLAAGTVALRPVRVGELVPASALGRRRDLGLRAVMVPVDAAAASVLAVGSEVDVWVSERDQKATTERYTDPERAVERATVSRLPSDRAPGGISRERVAVQLVVPEGQVARVIAHVDREAKITLVPAAGTPLREDG